MHRTKSIARQYLDVPGTRVQIAFAVLNWVFVLAWPSGWEYWLVALAWTVAALAGGATYIISTAIHQARSAERFGDLRMER